MKFVALVRTVACCALALPACHAHAQLEGTLFTQPEEREYLDYLREEFRRTSQEGGFDIQAATIPEIPGTETAVDPGPVEFSFGGLMMRRDGSRSVWLNGQLLAESELPAGISLSTGERSASLRIAQNDDVFMLRPGQTVDLTTGSVVENFQRRQAEQATESPTASAPDEASDDPPSGNVPAESIDTEETTGLVQTEPTASITTMSVGAVDETETMAATATELTPAQRTEVVVDALSRMSPEEMGQLAEVLQRMQEESVDEP